MNIMDDPVFDPSIQKLYSSVSTCIFKQTDPDLFTSQEIFHIISPLLLLHDTKVPIEHRYLELYRSIDLIARFYDQYLVNKVKQICSILNGYIHRLPHKIASVKVQGQYINDTLKTRQPNTQIG